MVNFLCIRELQCVEYCYSFCKLCQPVPTKSHRRERRKHKEEIHDEETAETVINNNSLITLYMYQIISVFMSHSSFREYTCVINL